MGEVNLPLWIYTEADPEMGAGHVVRCSAYADEWRARGHQVKWLLRGDAHFARGFTGEEADLCELDWITEAAEPPRDATCIVDSYSVGVDQIARIRSSCRSIAVLDDECRLPYTQAVVIHTSPGPVLPLGGDALWALGPAWQPLRKAFTDKPTRVAPPEVNSILVIMGGSDSRRLSAPMAQIARETFPSARITIVGGDGKVDVEGPTDHFPLLSANQLATVMQDADVAISAAGQTTFELAAMGVPSVLVAVAQNQANHIEYWPATGAFVGAGWWDSQNVHANVARALDVLRPAQTRQLLSDQGRSLVDGRGTERLYRMLNDA